MVEHTWLSTPNDASQRASVDNVRATRASDWLASLGAFAANVSHQTHIPRMTTRLHLAKNGV